MPEKNITKKNITEKNITEKLFDKYYDEIYNKTPESSQEVVEATEPSKKINYST